LAKACVDIMENINYEKLCDGVVNVGKGGDVTILELVETIRMIVNPKAVYTFNGNRAGVHSKLMDSTRMLGLGWKPETELEDGIKQVYGWYKTRSCD